MVKHHRGQNSIRKKAASCHHEGFLANYCFFSGLGSNTLRESFSLPER